jgi:hypothetical protein
MELQGSHHQALLLARSNGAARFPSSGLDCPLKGGEEEVGKPNSAVLRIVHLFLLCTFFLFLFLN